MKSVLNGALAAALLSSAAFLSSAAVVSSAAWAGEPVDWNGSYIGLHVGGGYSAPGVGIEDSNLSNPDFNSSGFLGGVSVGHDWQSGHFVYGVVGDVDYLGWDRHIFDGKADDFSYDLDWAASARARAGMAYADGLLVYGTAGVAVAGIGTDSSYNGYYGGSPVSDSATRSSIGGVAGFGIEHKFLSNLSLDAEYLQYFMSRVSAGGSDATTNAAFDPSFGTLRIGINYRF